MIRLNTPLTKKQLGELKTGDRVFLSGTIYTARDQAHRRLCGLLAKGEKPPFDLKGQVIYYCGPTKTPKGKIIGSCGPTTSRRMDEFVEPLLKKGLAGMIGKGSRSDPAIRAIRKYKGVYFLAFAGCGALISEYVKSAKVIGFPDLGPEAVRRLEVRELPLIVALDHRGRDIFREQTR